MFTELIGYQTITDSIQVLSHIHFRISLDYKCSSWYLTSVAERCKALTFQSTTGVVWVRIPLETYIFILNFSHPPRSGQRRQCKWNQAWPFTCSHSCLRLQKRSIIKGLVYSYLQYSFKSEKAVGLCCTNACIYAYNAEMLKSSWTCQSFGLILKILSVRTINIWSRNITFCQSEWHFVSNMPTLSTTYVFKPSVRQITLAVPLFLKLVSSLVYLSIPSSPHCPLWYISTWPDM